MIRLGESEYISLISYCQTRKRKEDDETKTKPEIMPPALFLVFPPVLV